MDPQSINNQKNMLFRYLLLLVFVVFAFVLFFLYQTRKNTEDKRNFDTIIPPASVQPSPNSVTGRRVGSFSLKSASEINTGDVDKALDVDIVASSDQKSIVGYDAVVKFEKGGVDVVSAKSLLPDFDVFTLKKSDYYIVTGTKKLGSQESTILDNTAILRLTLMPKKPGTLVLTLAETLGLEKSQMVDTESKILTPQLGEIILEIQ